jgi:hypothetical protein
MLNDITWRRVIPKICRFPQNCIGILKYVGYPESKECFAIKKYVLIIGKKMNKQVVAHTFTNFST